MAGAIGLRRTNIRQNLMSNDLSSIEEENNGQTDGLFRGGGGIGHHRSRVPLTRIR